MVKRESLAEVRKRIPVARITSRTSQNNSRVGNHLQKLAKQIPVAKITSRTSQNKFPRQESFAKLSKIFQLRESLPELRNIIPALEIICQT